MKDIYMSFKEILAEENETIYELIYDAESYLIYVVHDGEFHNKLWKCEKEIPEELTMFVDYIVRRELER